MYHARRTIPWGSHIPFHVRIIDEHVTRRIKIEVVLIAVTNGDDFPCGTFRVRFRNPSARSKNASGVPIGIPLSGQEQVLIPIRCNSTGRTFGHLADQLLLASSTHRLWWSICSSIYRWKCVITAIDVNRLAVGR